MKNFCKDHEIQLKLILSLTIGIIILTTAFYFLIPYILNYPEGTYNSEFQVELENTNYNVQTFLISVAILLVFIIIVFFQTHFLSKYKEMFSNSKKYTAKEINYVRNRLYNTPYTMYLLNIIAPSLIITTVHAFTINQFGTTTLKIFILLFSFITIYVSGVLLYSKKLFKELLLKLPTIDEVCYNRVSIKYRFFYHILPMVIVGILFTALLGYSRLILEKGDSLFEIYRERLDYYTVNINNAQDLINLASTFPTYNSNDIVFIKLPNGEYINKDGKEIEFSAYFNKYLSELSSSKNGRVYEYYGVDAQGATKEIEINGQIYTFGIYFEVTSNQILLFFLIVFAVLLLINILTIWLFSNSYASDITTVVESFTNMTQQKGEGVAEKIAVASNDEVGDLCVAFNKVQNLTQKHINQIHSSQDILVERERLASLGQMIGGIAHNLKTPIMSIAGAAEGLTDLIKEYDSSIEDPEVNAQDHHDIAKDMQTWVDKVKDYTSYMSDVITAVKGQAVTLSDEQATTFNVEELVKRVNILMRHELKNALVSLNVGMNVDPSLELEGNINSLVQVINNMISNAIQCYGGKPDNNIDMNFSREGNELIIEIRDYGPGLPKEVKDKLFKEMITTKGKNGTGLGLFMSYSNIRAHFNGNITFESEQGKRNLFLYTFAGS